MLEFKDKERPVLNSFFVYSNMYETKQYNMQSLMAWVKKTPEVLGIIKRIAVDIVTNIEFSSIKEQLTGRPSPNFKKKIEDNAIVFSKSNFFKQKMIQLVFDWLITGDAYIWLGKLKDSKVKEILDKYNTSYKTDISVKEIIDEDYNGINLLEIVPSTTMFINHDEIKILGYTQVVGVNKRLFNTDEVVHGIFMPLDGKVYGYSPMVSCFGPMNTLSDIESSARNFFNNGGYPDKVFMFPKEMASSPTFKAAEQALEKYKHAESKHGNMLIAGEVEIQDLNTPMDKMEHRQLAVYLTGKIAFAFNMPSNMISSILGVDIKGSSGSSDLEDTGYYRSIEEAQDYWETLLNSQLWNPYFSVDMKFERKFRQDEIRISQARTQNIAAIQFLKGNEFPINEEFYYELLHIPRKYREEGKIKFTQIQLNQETQQEGTQVANKKASDNEDKKKYSEEKKKQQEPQQRNNPPLGKEKGMFQIPFKQFLDEIRRWKLTADSSERIDVEEKDENFIFYLSLPNKVYAASVKKTELTEMDKFELGGKCIAAKRVDENIDLLSKISTKLDTLNTTKLDIISENATNNNNR